MKVHNGSDLLYCDGEGAVNILSSPKPYIKLSTKHFDILSSFLQAMHSTSIQRGFYHVKGNQDEYIAYADLSQPAQLNVLPDSLTKDKMTQCLQSQDCVLY